MEEVAIGVLGGCGLYEVDQITDKVRYTINTPFGKPSDEVVVGTLSGKRVAFIARHGEAHTLSPSRVPYRANIYVLKQLGVRFLISVNAVGSLRQELAPGHFVIPDQLYDQTRDRPGRTFFEDGIVVHISTAEPFCAELATTLYQAVQSVEATVHMGGVLVTIEGPRFSTRFESNVFRQLGCDIIGMTSSPEAYLAREAEMSYAAMTYVTDYDSWQTNIDPVSVKGLYTVMQQSAHYAQEALTKAVTMLDETQVCKCHTALDAAVLTRSRDVSDTALSTLRPIIARRLAKRLAHR